VAPNDPATRIDATFSGRMMLAISFGPTSGVRIDSLTPPDPTCVLVSSRWFARWLSLECRRRRSVRGSIKRAACATNNTGCVWLREFARYPRPLGSHLKPFGMLSHAQSRPPKSVTIAVVAASIAWIDSAAALAINQLIYNGSSVGPGPLLGIVSLVVQMTAIVLVARGSSIGRVLVAFFFIIAILPLPMVARLISGGSTMAAAYLALGFVLKGAATFLLFTGESNQWFNSVEDREPRVIR
jgi:hypothetical protein